MIRRVEHGRGPLTARQRQILVMMADGKLHKEIATDLGITVRTVEDHVRQIRVRLGIYSVALLTRYAIRQGWILP